MRAKVFQATFFLFLFNSFYSFTPSVLATTNVSSSDHWPSLNRVLNDFLWPMRGSVVRNIEEVLRDDRVYKLSPACNASLAYFVAGLSCNREDAFRVLDSWSKVRPGLLSGEYTDFGHWDQCVSTVLHEPSSEQKVTGQYCMYHLAWPLHESIDEDKAAESRHKSSWIRHLIADSDSFRFAKVALAGCLPSTCTRDEVQSIVDAFTGKYEIPLKISLDETCDTLDDFQVPYSSTPIYKQACGYSLATLILLVIFSTLGLYFKPELASYSFIKAFDARYNSNKLNYSVLDPDQRELTYIFGLRTLYLSICIYAHFVFVSGMANVETHMGLAHFQGPSNPVLSGLTQMSGLLVSWNVVVGAALAFFYWFPIFVKTRARVSFFTYLIPRVLRSTPVVAGTLMLILAYPPSWGSGPVFRKSYAQLTKNCLDSWWMELLFIANQRKATESCIVHGWYIASDLQLYAVAFILIHAFQRNTKLGVALCFIGVVIGMAAQGFVTWYYNTGMSFAFTVQRIHVSIRETHLLHFATINYISSYCIGIVLGYVILHKIKVQKKFYLLGWAIAFSLMFGVTYWHDFLFKELEATRWQIVLTASTLRTIMAIIGAWFIYSMWIGIQYKTFPLICRWVMELFCAHFLGYLMYLILEAPFNNLTKVYLGKSKAHLNCTRTCSSSISASSSSSCATNGKTKAN